MIRHIALGGVSGAGKSTLLNRLLKETSLPVYGFKTKLHRDSLTDKGNHPVYIYPVCSGPAEYTESEKNLVGEVSRGTHIVYSEVFETLGVDYLSNIPERGIIVMDELGFLESGSVPFQNAVFAAFAKITPVIAVVKERYDIDFLNKIRALPGLDLYTVTEENREELFHELAPIIRSWNQD